MKTPKRKSDSSAPAPTRERLRPADYEDRKLGIEERRHDFQREMLRPIIRFFIFANCIVLVAIGCLAGYEAWLAQFQPDSQRVVTDRVLVAATASLAVQTGSIIIAAFKGLFGFRRD